MGLFRRRNRLRGARDETREAKKLSRWPRITKMLDVALERTREEIASINERIRRKRGN